MDLGPHAAYIWGSYAAVALVVAGLIGWVVLDARRQRRALDRLEAQGVRRRSAAPRSGEPGTPTSGTTTSGTTTTGPQG